MSARASMHTCARDYACARELLYPYVCFVSPHALMQINSTMNVLLVPIGDIVERRKCPAAGVHVTHHTEVVSPTGGAVLDAAVVL